ADKLALGGTSASTSASASSTSADGSSAGGVGVGSGSAVSAPALSAIEDLRLIMSCVDAVKDDAAQGGFQLIFDPTLVRGMGYYTGPIFEISLKEFGSSVGGGGRYDQLIGKFTNLQAPACGFSIGFERIISVLMDQGYQPPSVGAKVAFLAEKGLSGDDLAAMLSQAGSERRAGATVLVAAKNKNVKHQIEQLEKDGYTEFRQFNRSNSHTATSP
ncbi:MAG: ATP phosphoribosyltransferase regulatory subunit, partial [Clostridiales bacterium]|nr:ATP phosphoribosyltransferase regulatory subunit [Clostridiales bacterium]